MTQLIIFVDLLTKLWWDILHLERVSGPVQALRFQESRIDAAVWPRPRQWGWHRLCEHQPAHLGRECDGAIQVRKKNGFWKTFNSSVQQYCTCIMISQGDLKRHSYLCKQQCKEQQENLHQQRSGAYLIEICNTILKSLVSRPFVIQQRNSAVFTATNRVDDTYDAYERDIAIVSFYFEYPTTFEYIR